MFLLNLYTFATPLVVFFTSWSKLQIHAITHSSSHIQSIANSLYILPSVGIQNKDSKFILRITYYEQIILQGMKL